MYIRVYNNVVQTPNGKSEYEAAVIAADYTLECIKVTQGDDKHWYGVKFEAALPFLVTRLDF